MPSRLTVHDCRVQLSEYVVPPPGSAEQRDDRFLRYLNQASERLLQWMTSRNIFEQVIFPAAATTGIITLPPQFDAIVGAVRLKTPVPSFDHFLEFIENGMGTFDETVVQDMMVQLPGTYCITTDIVTPSVITMEYSGDDEFSLRICGVDSNGDAVLDDDGNEGELLAFTGTSPVTSTNTFARITRIVKEETKQRVTLKSGTTTLVRLLPWETVPAYARYKVGTSSDTLTCLCRRRHTPIRSDDDGVYPDNVGALKHALLTLNYEDNNDLERAQTNWQTACQLLSAEIKSARGGAHPSNRFQPWGWGIGNTPNLT